MIHKVNNIEYSMSFTSTFNSVISSFFGRLVRLVRLFFGRLIEGRISQNLWRVKCSNGSHKWTSKPAVFMLPEDCLLHVLGFLSECDLVTCSLVCKQWHQVVSTWSTLWKRVKLRLAKRPGHIRHYLSQLEKQQHHVLFLIRKKVLISHLTVKFTQFDESSFNTLAMLLSSGCCEKLQHIQIRWCNEPASEQTGTQFEKNFVFFLSCLKILQTFSKSTIHSFDMQFFGTMDSVEYVSSFVKLKYLRLRWVPKRQCMQRWHLNELLSSLKYLTVIKLDAIIMLKSLQKFSFTSPTLRVINISGCINFIITQMDLPRLNIFTAFNVRYNIMCKDIYTFCFFNVLKSGCPDIETINDQRLVKNDDNFGLSSGFIKDSKLCMCHNHR